MYNYFGDKMNTIKNNINNTIIVNKSTFITEIIKIKNKEEAMQELTKVKEKYKDASHYCYAYIIDDNKKSSDDGEPGGTAGIPIMEVLTKFELNYIICIVIRYFGGIKLGAGGLIRTYRKAVISAINNNKNNIVSLIDGYNLIIEIPYSEQKELEFILKENYSKEYKEKVIYNIKCDIITKKLLEQKYKIKEEEKIKIER